MGAAHEALAPLLVVAVDPGAELGTEPGLEPGAARLADRLALALPGGLDGPVVVAADALAALVRGLDPRQPCIYLGPAEPLVLALAPLIAAPTASRCAPIVLLTRDATAIPLLGTAAGAARLAARIVQALTAPDPAPAPVSAPAAVPADDIPGAPASAARATGRLAVVGLGPGAAGLMAPDVRAELDQAEAIIGYRTYLELAGPFRPGQRVLASDNREELARARQALALAAAGERVVVVCSGDPGVFAMAAAVLEALEQAPEPSWQALDIEMLPGISAAQAAAARAGAPLGHDFCVLSLSDNLKPWAQIARRLDHAAAADLVIALYNPRSRARPGQLQAALDLLRAHRAPTTPVVLGREVGRPGEQVLVTTLGAVRPEQVDMRTVVIIGSSQTRQFPRPGGVWVYTPRWYPRPLSEGVSEQVPEATAAPPTD